jgi:hypothetical protein
MSMQPAVAALIGLALLSQRLSPAEWIGIGCVVIASAAASRRPAPAPAPALPRSQALGAAAESPLCPLPPEPNASATGAVNGALRWSACFPV